MKRLIILLLAVVAVLAEEPAVSANVEKIAFTHCYLTYDNNGEQIAICNIWLANPDGEINPDGSVGTPLTEGASPAWSPDGTMIAFVSAQRSLSLLNLATGTVVNLTGQAAGDTSPAWSPDRARIAFASDRSGAKELYVINADGSGVMQLTSNVGFAGSTAWSPDGNTITFDCAENNNYDICEMNADGSAMRRLLGGPTQDAGASWSPVDARIAFTTSGFGTETVLATMNSDGSGIMRIGTGISGYGPIWSPDASRIAFVSPVNVCQDEFCEDAIDVMNSDGSGVTGLAGTSSRASWTSSPLTHFLAPPVPSIYFSCDRYTCTFDGSQSWDNYGVASLSWDFGDGSTGSGPRVSHTYAVSGTYTATLTVTDTDGLTSSHSETFPVANQPPVASFALSCSGRTCSVDASGSSDPDGTIASYSWNFGDGATASGMTATHTYTAANDYNIYLFVTDNNGASSVQVKTVSFSNAAPVASFTFACSNRTCAFNGAEDGTIASYAWSFGDGSTGSGSTATHTYARTGAFTVTLTVTDNNGVTAAQSQAVSIVNAPPAASFTFACIGLTCTFDGSASSDPDGTITSYAWDFAGTSGSGQIATHTYPASGSYTATLRVFDNEGASGLDSKGVTVTNAPPVASFTFACNSRACTFNGSGSSDPDGTIASYAWSFGDGSTGSGSTATHIYAAAGGFTVALTVTDNNGATAAQSKTVSVVNAPPAASFTFACIGLTCTFDGSASSDPDGTIASYAWDFAGTSGSGQIATHTYPASGSYTATLRVFDNEGASGLNSKVVTVTNAPPVASFTFACNSHTCTFDGSGSSDPDGTIASYAWNFGDGGGGSGATTTHTYNISGTFNVTLTVTDNNGATASRGIAVGITNTAPAASFTSACSGRTCTFDGTSSSDPDGTIAGYAWTFGDGSGGSGTTTSHTYSGSGTFAITLTVTDNGSATNTATHSVTIAPPEMHSGDLDGAAARQGSAWSATVTVTMHDASHNRVANATVSGSWSSGGTSSCTTNAAGQCSIAVSALSIKLASVTFTLQTATSATYNYQPASNHDPDGDSNGTAIIVRKP